MCPSMAQIAWCEWFVAVTHTPKWVRAVQHQNVFVLLQYIKKNKKTKKQVTHLPSHCPAVWKSRVYSNLLFVAHGFHQMGSFAVRYIFYQKQTPASGFYHIGNTVEHFVLQHEPNSNYWCVGYDFAQLWNAVSTLDLFCSQNEFELVLQSSTKC